MRVLESRLAGFPRIELTRDRTPLQHLRHLSRRLARDVLLKRDDLTDLTLGGDKPRKLEYELAAAVADGADVLVACGSSQSNFARLITAAARRLGLDCALVLNHGRHSEDQGNLLVVRLMGAEVRMVDKPDIWDLERECLDLCDELRDRGRSPYYVPVSGTTARSSLGYLRAGFELADQLADAGHTPAALYSPFGTGGIFTGLALALRERRHHFPLIGVSVNGDRQRCARLLQERVTEVTTLLGQEPRDLGHTELRDDQLGGGYGEVTPSCLDAIVELAETEGVLLDPVYSGKVAAALLADLRADRWPAGSTVVMIHSGGVPAIFAYHAELLAHLAGRRKTTKVDA